MLTLVTRLTALLALVPAAFADPVFRSGPAQVALVELYTSEGCSSCPPAEKWLGELRTAPGLWKEFVPVALHVNYWDHLGWRDALASKTFTEREHAYAAAWRSSSVYTPCFVRNGEEWRPRDVATLGRGAADAGMLTATWNDATQTCRIDFTPAVTTAARKTAEHFSVGVAFLGGGIVSEVRKGENSGRALRHEFVALRFATAALERESDGTWSGAVVLPAVESVKAPRHALAAWITGPAGLVPLQAAGGWLE